MCFFFLWCIYMCGESPFPLLTFTVLLGEHVPSPAADQLPARPQDSRVKRLVDLGFTEEEAKGYAFWPVSLFVVCRYVLSAWCAK